MRITTTRSLLTGSWTANVQELETAIEDFKADRRRRNDCHVAFFEVPRDPNLHINVTHKRLTIAVNGWNGPARLPAGFVHNRTFVDMAPSQMIRHIRNMLFAAPR